jgi:hypothetical protein
MTTTNKFYPLTDPKEYADYAAAWGLKPREIEGALKEIKALPGVTDEYLAEVAFAFEQIFEIDLGAL